MWLSMYLCTSCLLARISNDMLPSNLSVISRMNLKVVKMFALDLARRLKISKRNLERHPLDA
jgi:hypothetical protein